MLRRTLAGVALLALMASAAPAQTVDELIAKNIQARGGMEKLKALQSLRVDGRMIMAAQGIEAPFTNCQKRPKMARTQFSVMGMTGIQAFDGTNAWVVSPFTGSTDPQLAPAEQASTLEEGADIEGPLMNYKDKGYAIELVGKEKVEGADAYKLKVTSKSGHVRYTYLDAESGLEVKSDGKGVINGSEVETESFYRDYKDVGGVMVAFTVESGVKDSPMGKRKMVIDSVKVNVPLPDSLFALPASLKDAAAKADAAKATAAPASTDSTHAAAAAKDAKKAKDTKAKKP